ncbi:TdiB protein [Colletotrichum somersetense]|nr:TdiB protein [Colletotrichum somersetense]
MATIDATGSVLVQSPTPKSFDAYPNADPEDVQFWASYLVPRFRMYLAEASSYTVKQQEAHASCFSAAVEALGPRHPHPYVKSVMTPNSSPIELSLNLSEDRPPTVRFYLEPLGYETGTDEDPFGELWTPHSFSCLAAQVASVDARWYQHLREAFRLKDKNEINKAKTGNCPGVWLPTMFMGIDFVGDHRLLKCSFCPIRKLLAMGADWNHLADHNQFVLDVVRQLPGFGANARAALDVLGQYIVESPKTTASVRGDGVGGGLEDSGIKRETGSGAKRPMPFFNLVSVDCSDLNKGRVKLYARINSTSFASIRDAVTLGGRLTDEVTMDGLRHLQSVWHLLLNDPTIKNDTGYARPVDPVSICQGIDINWEISEKLPVPHAKVYVPVHIFHANDVEVNRNLCQIFKKLQWNDWAEGRYEVMLQRVFPEADFATSHINTWVSFCYYKGRGSYMTMYHNPLF